MKQVNGKKNGKSKITWANASDQIQLALARLEDDTDAGITSIRSKLEVVEEEAKAVGVAAKAAAKRSRR